MFALVRGPLARMELHAEIIRTNEHMESRVNGILNKADAPETAHIPVAEKDKVKGEAIAELRKMKEVAKMAEKHDWKTDFNANIKQIHDE